MECIKNMGKRPKFILSDDEGALNSNDILGYLKKEGIEKITTRSHAHFVERFLRTVKFASYKRIENDEKKGKTNIQWTKYISGVLTTYNYKDAHGSTGTTPEEAKKEDNKIEVKLNMELKAKRFRKYPDFQVGDKVEIMLKYNKFRKRETRFTHI